MLLLTLINEQCYYFKRAFRTSLFRGDAKIKNESDLIFSSLTLRTLGKIFSGRHIDIFSYFPHKTSFDVSCKLSPLETICMKCQNLFSRKNKKKNHQLMCHLLTLAQRVIMVKAEIPAQLSSHSIHSFRILLNNQ